MLVLRPLRKIKAGEQLFISYGAEYFKGFQTQCLCDARPRPHIPPASEETPPPPEDNGKTVFRMRKTTGAARFHPYDRSGKQESLPRAAGKENTRPTSSEGSDLHLKITQPSMRFEMNLSKPDR